jgi:hypothetical protein
MSDEGARGEELRAQIAEKLQALKEELSARLDQLLDELGALI